MDYSDLELSDLGQKSYLNIFQLYLDTQYVSQ